MKILYSNLNNNNNNIRFFTHTDKHAVRLYVIAVADDNNSQI